MIGSVFGSVHDFFQSSTWTAVEVGLLAFVVLVYCATVFWVNKDARRRIADSVLVAAATLLGALPPFLGPLLYMLVRPPEYLEDVRERELEIRAIETRLAGAESRCGVCGCRLDLDFLVCPVCATRVRQACEACARPLEPAWQVCPYCENPVGVQAARPPARSASSQRSTRSPTSR